MKSAAEHQLDEIAKILAPYLVQHLAPYFSEEIRGDLPESSQLQDDRAVALRMLDAPGASKSSVMRQLWAGGNGWSRSRIAKALGASYQFVYNQTPPVKAATQSSLDKRPAS